MFAFTTALKGRLKRSGNLTAALPPTAPEPAAQAGDYCPPLLIPQGPVRAVTRGNSSSGIADANSQFYW